MQSGISYTLCGFMPYKAKSKNPSDEIRLIVRSNENDYDEFPLDEHVKIILRPLSDMRDEEKFGKPGKSGEYPDKEIFSFEHTRYLLSKHFDLFGLIEAGIAIDKTTLKQ